MNSRTWIFEGDLYSEALGYDKPLRTPYARHFREIQTGLQLRASLRAGDAVWPGGYGVAYVTEDSAWLCPGCVRKELRSVINSIRNGQNDGWRVIVLTHTGENDEEIVCEQCNKVIE